MKNDVTGSKFKKRMKAVGLAAIGSVILAGTGAVTASKTKRGKVLLGNLDARFSKGMNKLFGERPLHEIKPRVEIEYLDLSESLEDKKKRQNRFAIYNEKSKRGYAAKKQIEKLRDAWDYKIQQNMTCMPVNLNSENVLNIYKKQLKSSEDLYDKSLQELKTILHALQNENLYTVNNRNKITKIINEIEKRFKMNLEIQRNSIIHCNYMKKMKSDRNKAKREGRPFIYKKI